MDNTNHTEPKTTAPMRDSGGLSGFPKVTCRSMAGDGPTKSAASRRFVAPSAERLAKWMASDLIQSRPADYAD